MSVRLFVDASSLSEDLSNTSAWFRVASDYFTIEETTDVEPPEQGLKVFKLTAIVGGVGDSTLSQKVFVGGQVSSLTPNQRIWARANSGDVSSATDARLQAFTYAIGTVQIKSTLIYINSLGFNSWHLTETDYSPYSGGTSAGSSYTQRLDPFGRNSSTIGDVIYIAGFQALLSNHVVDLSPEWDFEDGEFAIRDDARSKTGKRFSYQWGTYDRFKIALKNVSSRDASLINSWWENNTNTLLQVTSGPSLTSSVHIMGNKTPLAKYVKPYDDEYMGAIILETY